MAVRTCDVFFSFILSFFQRKLKGTEWLTQGPTANKQKGNNLGAHLSKPLSCFDGIPSYFIICSDFKDPTDGQCLVGHRKDSRLLVTSCHPLQLFHWAVSQCNSVNVHKTDLRCSSPNHEGWFSKVFWEPVDKNLSFHFTLFIYLLVPG